MAIALQHALCHDEESLVLDVVQGLFGAAPRGEGAGVAGGGDEVTAPHESVDLVVGARVVVRDLRLLAAAGGASTCMMPSMTGSAIHTLGEDWKP